MGKCNILKSGSGGLDTDELTAVAADVLTGKTAGISGTDRPIAGTMPNRGAINQSLNAGGSYTIPAGYHNGAGKVTATALSSQTSANATAAQILTGQTAWVNGAKVTGSMTNRGTVSQSLTINGGYTIPAGYHNGSGRVTQSIPVQGGSTTIPGTANKTVVAANRYVNGNIIVAGSGNLTAQNIKKGVNIFGVTGTWEGYTGDVYYIFNAGTWAGLSSPGMTKVSTTSGTVTIGSTINIYGNGNRDGTVGAKTNASFDFTNYNYLKIVAKKYGNYSGDLGYVKFTGDPLFPSIGGISFDATENYYTSIMDISKLNGFYWLSIYYSGYKLNYGLTISQIYVSKT